MPKNEKKRSSGGRETPMERVSSEKPLSLKNYVILNLIFWAYCAVQLLVLKWLLRDVAGLYFFFAVLAVAFTVVSIYDYLYERLAKEPADDSTTNSVSSET
ncbi:hypothetical protein J7M23_05575 [Candidatus Sumerlaeota bacterium]|nr:hypothetical protein [Candidatus Sumerlaeota bacterium]